MWNTIAPDEYGFYSNVNPDRPHPRWSQASERRIGEFDRPWWWLFWNVCETRAVELRDMRSPISASLRAQVDLARRGIGWTVNAGKLPEIEEAALRLVQIPVDSSEFQEWAKHMRRNGVENFRPIDLAVSYDGRTLYVADWGMGGWGSTTERVGRVFAITY